MQEMPPPLFTASTLINSLPDGIQIIVPFAPQVSMIVHLSLEQVKEALERSLKMRVPNQDAIRAIRQRSIKP